MKGHDGVISKLTLIRRESFSNFSIIVNDFISSLQMYVTFRHDFFQNQRIRMIRKDQKFGPDPMRATNDEKLHTLRKACIYLKLKDITIDKLIFCRALGAGVKSPLLVTLPHKNYPQVGEQTVVEYLLYFI